MLGNLRFSPFAAAHIAVLFPRGSARLTAPMPATYSAIDLTGHRREPGTAMVIIDPGLGDGVALLAESQIGEFLIIWMPERMFDQTQSDMSFDRGMAMLAAFSQAATLMTNERALIHRIEQALLNRS